MASYQIVGPLNVVYREPGSIITDDDLELCSIDWLIETGHISPIKADKAVTKED